MFFPEQHLFDSGKDEAMKKICDHLVRITEAHKGHHCKYFFRKFFLFPQGFFLFPQGYFLFPQGYFLFPQGLFNFRKVCFISARFTYLRKVLFISARFASFPQGYIISARFILFPQGYFYFPEVSSFIFSIWVSPMPISLHYCSKRAITPNDLGLAVPWW